MNLIYLLGSDSTAPFANASVVCIVTPQKLTFCNFHSNIHFNTTSALYNCRDSIHRNTATLTLCSCHSGIHCNTT